MKKYIDARGVWARYLINAKEVEIRIMFPEQCGEIPHWTKGPDGWWYYHTFYPHQPDVNWQSYHVFVAFMKILVYWAKKGVSFRLDAVPFVGKEIASGKIESSQRTQMIIQALNLVVKKANRSGVFLVEANQPVKVIKSYFGTKTNVNAEMAYSFGLMADLWLGLIQQNAKVIWDGLIKMEGIPKSGSWVNFLRNHDELTLEFVDKEQRKELIVELGKMGRVMRKGFGIAGRSLSLLSGDVKRYLMAYTLLASMPGNLAIVFGDELGKMNDVEQMVKVRDLKRLRVGDPTIEIDARDVNRGRIERNDWKTKRSRRIYSELSELFQARWRYREDLVKYPTKLDLDERVFGARYGRVHEPLNVLVNLSSESVRVPASRGRLVYEVNEARIEKAEVVLPAFGACWLKGWK